MEVKFKWRHDCGDATATYDVEISNPCTIAELLGIILERSKKYGEWGDVSVGKGLLPEVFLFKFANGRILDSIPVWAERYPKGILEEYRNKQVSSVMANGGYGCMGYVIHIAP